VFSLRQCLEELERAGHLVRIEEEVDPKLEAAEIHRRVFARGGPALLFARVRGCAFPMVSNLFGTLERAHFLFRHTLHRVRRAMEVRLDPGQLRRRPLRYLSVPRTAWHMRPRWVRRAPVLAHQTTLRGLPQLVCWPGDGGPFITLPQCYTEDPTQPGWQHSNLGMYRVQLAGNAYVADREVGLHYQIHRGIGVHHQAALRSGQKLPVHVFVGGHPAMTLAAVMPLPEGMSELGLAGALAGYRIPLVRPAGGALPIYAEADFCLVGHVDPGAPLKPEGPFGDHLGYYSLRHNFPVLQVERVYHRPDAVWPFTVVGRPPQEDTIFGQLIHELTADVIPKVLPGIRAVHAVDAAGVHPLLLAIGSERYVPYQPLTRPAELLTQACAILGQGQLSLAKFLWIINGDDDPHLSVDDLPAFFKHVLARVDWRRDLHFHTCTTIDTLDYSGGALNEGSKVVIAAVGPPRRELPDRLPADIPLPAGFRLPRVVLPGIVVLAGPPARPPVSNPRELLDQPPAAPTDHRLLAAPLEQLADALTPDHPLARFPFVVVVDDPQFASASLANFLWVTFTRTNPAADIYGAGAFVEQKHWGCTGPLILDARLKPHHAPPLEPDADVAKRVDALAARGGPLARWL
jgi:4-hydroxy-3-polyprenylbenzoate decarboxylase